jgi:hypothetical protein
LISCNKRKTKAHAGAALNDFEAGGQGALLMAWLMAVAWG